MATRSFIGKLNENGTVTGVYCHWDGYPDGVGKVLTEHYTDPSKVDELIELGSLSSLAERVAPEPGEHHTFEWPAPGVTVAYGRDRGERGTSARTYRGIKEYKRLEHDFGAAYAYVFDGVGEWNTYKL